MPYGSETSPERSRQLVLDEPLTGIILAGGRSRRMGSDKAWLTLAGRPLALWVLDALRAVTDEQMIVAREAGRLGQFGAQVVVDRMSAPGPLTGLHAGLKASATDLNLVVACDLPLVRPELLAFLAHGIGPAHAAVPYTALGPPPAPAEYTTAREAGLQPLCAAYRRACIGPLEKLLRSGPLPTVVLTSVIKTRILGPDAWGSYDPDGRSFFNINTPADLVAAARLLVEPTDRVP